MNHTKKLTICALLLTIGMVLPFFTMQIRQIGNMLLPMHIPIILCGFICGWQYGLAVGFVMPILRSLIFSMPQMIPSAVTMAFELATYGFVAGLLYRYLKGKKFAIYISLIASMLIGRIVWGIVSFLVYGLIIEKAFGFELFLSGAFLKAVPGIIIQIILIPPIVALLQNKGILDKK